jgi:APA family basic amino acid/polyamine antiporter
LQVGFAAFKGSVLIALVIALLANPGSVSPTQPASVLRSDWIAIGTALVVIWNTFNGWQNVVFFAEEVDDPGRNIPRSLVFGILAITAIYLLVNFALIHTLGTADMAGSKLAVADAAGLAIGETADVAIAIFSVISVAAIANYMLVSASRLLFSLARAGLFPVQMAYVDPRGTPLFAMLAIALAASGFLLTGTYLTLVSMQAPSTILALIVVMAALVILRRREPDLARPFRVPLYPFSVGFVILFASALFVVSLIQDPISGALGLLVNGGLIAAVLILAGERAKEARPPDLNEDDQ